MGQARKALGFRARTPWSEPEAQVKSYSPSEIEAMVLGEAVYGPTWEGTRPLTSKVGDLLDRSAEELRKQTA